MVKTLKNSFVGLVAAVFVFAAFATPAKAQTVAELQAQIQTLLAQLNAMSGGNTTSGTCYVHSATLRVGSTGSQVMALQSALGITADGKFGPMTASAVRSFQSSKGLTADGVVGPMTGAAIASACTPSTSTGGNTGGSTGSTTLNGGAGDITVDLSSKYSNEDVGEGEEDVPVLAFDIEADDESDVQITTVKVEFSQNTGADSDKLDDYVDEVTVWFDGKKVGSADADDFNESNDVYSRNITLSNVVIEAGDEEELVIAVSALNNLDSGDIDSDQFNVGVSSIRFMDGDGVVTTESYTLDVADGAADDTLEKLFDFEDFAGASDVELRASLEDESINEARVLIADDSEDTKHNILSFNLEARGDSDIWVDEIPVVITTTGETNESVIVLEATLWMDGDEIASESVADGGAVTFDDLDITIDAGDEVEFILQVELADTNGALDNGDTVQATLTVSGIDAEDEAGDTLAGGDLTGSAVGDAHGAYSEGILVKNFESSFVKTASDTSGVDESVQFNLEFEVEAFGDDMWVEQTCAVGTTGTDVDAIEVSVDNAGLNTGTCTFTSSTGDTGTHGFEVLEDQTETFTVTVLVVADNATATVRARLEGLGYNVGTDAVGDTVYAFNMDDFETSAVTIFNRP